LGLSDTGRSSVRLAYIFAIFGIRGMLKPFFTAARSASFRGMQIACLLIVAAFVMAAWKFCWQRQGKRSRMFYLMGG
jgi:uncharacterized membrane protein